MADEIIGAEKGPAATNTGATDRGKVCGVEKTGWLKGGLAMAACCAAPLLLIAAITVFGLSLGALASGLLSLAALLACPIGMYLMMRMAMKDKNKINKPTSKINCL
jgi:hypothetical protein